MSTCLFLVILTQYVIAFHSNNNIIHPSRTPLKRGKTIYPIPSIRRRGYFRTRSELFLNGSNGFDMETEEEEDETVDRAPCFDGVCDSDPILSSVKDDNNKEKEDDTPTLVDQTSSINGHHHHHHHHHQDDRGEAIQRLDGFQTPPPPPSVMNNPTVWSHFGRIASSSSHPIANLGQGFPNWRPPTFAIESLVEAALDSSSSPHQYTRTAGHPRLVKELARRYTKHLGRKLDAMSEVAVTVGASQALYLSLQTLVKPGDEVIIFEPFFDLYVNQIKLAGAIPIYVPLTFVPYDENGTLTGGEWILERSKLQSSLSPRTRAIILNSPHNPTGKVFSYREMTYIADAVQSLKQQNNSQQHCVVLSDEVYKYIIHSDPRKSSEKTPETPTCPGHYHFASLPSMYDHTITISSAGKTFSATGWQVGWCIGPSKLISPIHRLLPHVQFCASTVVQEALARALPKAEEEYCHEKQRYDSYYHYLKEMYIRKRDLLVSALQQGGMFAVPNYEITSGGGFFIFARVGQDVLDSIPQEYREKIKKEEKEMGGKKRGEDWVLCQWMAEELGVLCIPSSPFFSEERIDKERISDQFIRIAFCKTDETIEDAACSFLALCQSGDGSREKEMVVNGGKAVGNVS